MRGDIIWNVWDLTPYPAILWLSKSWTFTRIRRRLWDRRIVYLRRHGQNSRGISYRLSDHLGVGSSLQRWRRASQEAIVTLWRADKHSQRRRVKIVKLQKSMKNNSRLLFSDQTEISRRKARLIHYATEIFSCRILTVHYLISSIILISEEYCTLF